MIIQREKEASCRGVFRSIAEKRTSDKLYIQSVAV